ncbi:carbonic anhydrase family protein [Apilactobacillus nanyangensis]|uniref:carbonic anhydrase n=1 Tax=Apilactobacillus nanyangensis TaxID=2799579 RepID=A0ABT0HXA5_9LACO|nr:carbonic anhydrase family protein [Apilactobacillus nanyangensis]MCK8611556.1 carbonic anhydrase family protein [Apilactobacillus nanyangensis]TMT01812.1 carbonic anhydrase family protein [Apilactobacillus kunkeei]TMT03871.1 carbonic anhydrase family protein [Apilactobacillus kunkeei]
MLDYNEQNNWENDFGHCQSPIMLSTHDSQYFADYLPIHANEFYQLNTEIDDHTTIRLTGMGHATIFNRDFKFKQVHFHAPAEHIVDSKVNPIEIHLVHENEIGQTVVVAVFPTLGNANSELQDIINNFEEGNRHSVSLKLTNWISSLATGFHYQGSLTTPPLTEGIEWLVIDNSKLTVSPKQVDWFIDQFGKNNRDCQPLNDRNVQYYNK